MCLNTGGKGKEDLKSWTTNKINPTWMTSSRKKGQQSKLEKMVELRGMRLILRKRRKGPEEMTKTNTEIRIEIEIGTGLWIEREIDPGIEEETDQGKEGKIDPEIGKEAGLMIIEREGTDPETEAEIGGEAGPEIAIIEGIMKKTSHPDTEEDLLVTKTIFG